MQADMSAMFDNRGLFPRMEVRSIAGTFEDMPVLEAQAFVEVRERYQKKAI